MVEFDDIEADEWSYAIVKLLNLRDEVEKTHLEHVSKEFLDLLDRFKITKRN